MGYHRSLEWYAYAMKYEEDGKFLIFCEHCQQVFFISNNVLQRLLHTQCFKSTKGTLADLDCLSICCKHPKWLFVTEYFSPTRKLEEDEIAGNYLKAMRSEDQEKLMWWELLDDCERKDC